VTRLARNLVEVELEDGTSVSGTGNHPVWSETRQGWIALEELRPGEQLAGRSGPVAVAQVKRLPGSGRVYNLEIHGQHVYRVGPAGVLVHNNGGPCPPRGDGRPKPRSRKVRILRPDPAATGPHTVYKRDPVTGEITGYATFDEHGFLIKRVDITGKAHGGIPTPHTHVYGPPSIGPDGRMYPGRQIEVRPARPDELPSSGGH